MTRTPSSFDPLDRPENDELLRHFAAFHQMSLTGDKREQLRELVRAFSRLPYENLTKIVKESSAGLVRAARRTPHEVIADYERWRTGGTCFSLTATLMHLLRCLGLEAQPILADRKYGADTHCAVTVTLDDQRQLLDPGYLILDPIPLATIASGLVVPARFNQLELVAQSATSPGRIELYTVASYQRRYRLTYKLEPVDARQFRRAWEASFDWDMMRYPLITQVTDTQQVYMRGGYLQQRSLEQVVRAEVPEGEIGERIAREFGIAPEMIRRALRILHGKGELGGGAG